MVAIDYTASNGPPAHETYINRNGKKRTSLHYRNPNTRQRDVYPNDYQRVIREIGEILLPYDTDKLVETYGFGGMVDGISRAVFPLNLDDGHCSQKNCRDAGDGRRVATCSECKTSWQSADKTCSKCKADITVATCSKCKKPWVEGN